MYEVVVMMDTQNNSDDSIEYCDKHDMEKHHTGGGIYECPACVAFWRKDHPVDEWADDEARAERLLENDFHMVVRTKYGGEVDA